MKAEIEVEVHRRADGTFDVWWPTGDVTDQVPAEWLERHGIPVPSPEPVVPFNEAAERAREARQALRHTKETPMSARCKCGFHTMSDWRSQFFGANPYQQGMDERYEAEHRKYHERWENRNNT